MKQELKLTGLITCAECETSITAEKKAKFLKNNNVNKYVYYNCTKKVNPNCTQKTIEEAILNKHIEKYLERLHIPQELINWAANEVISEEKENPAWLTWF
jgi:predicted metal-binding protein